MLINYPLFLPPQSLAEKPPKEWSKSEAQAYHDWLLGQVGPRTAYLIDFLKLRNISEPEALLHEAQEKFEALLREEEELSTSSPTGKRLSNTGYAIAADLGLLVARLLVEHTHGRVSWSIVKRPKSDISFNLPVLQGFGDIPYDPIRVSIADALWILKGNQKPDAWVKVFKYVLAKSEEAAKPPSIH